jgi:twitching motility two-component system response regulator PilH
MHLRLRRRRLPRRHFGGVNLPSGISNPHKSNALYVIDTRAYLDCQLAADVHLWSAEYCRETAVVQKKVLIVDDSPAQVKLIQGFLEVEGYRSIGLSDPQRVEETIVTERPNVILLDVVMPGRNGFQVCRELKSHTDFNAIPVILVTSKDSASDRYWGQQQGADAYVTKPFTRDELLRAVKRFV